MSNNTVPIKEFRLELSDLTYTGHDLVRPESVLAQPNAAFLIGDTIREEKKSPGGTQRCLNR